MLRPRERRACTNAPVSIALPPVHSHIQGEEHHVPNSEGRRGAIRSGVPPSTAALPFDDDDDDDETDDGVAAALLGVLASELAEL